MKCTVLLHGTLSCFTLNFYAGLLLLDAEAVIWHPSPYKGTVESQNAAEKRTFEWEIRENFYLKSLFQRFFAFKLFTVCVFVLR